ncbi:hypothetical protein INR49_016414, partial [Caranx melampygus]
PNAVGPHGTDHALIGGVVAVVVFVTLCLIIVLGRYLARHKGTYLTNEAKGADDAPDADTAIINAEGTMHTQRKRKNTSFRLQGELCSSSHPPIFPLFQSLYLFFSLAVSPFSSPPLTTAPNVTTRNPQAVHRQRSSPKCFSCYCLSLIQFYTIYILSFITLFLFYFFLAASFSEAALPLLLI